MKLSKIRVLFADSMLFFAKNHFSTQNLLSDAEMREDVLEGFLAGDGTAGDFAKVGENEAEVFGYKVGRQLVRKAVDDTCEAVVGM